MEIATNPVKSTDPARNHSAGPASSRPADPVNPVLQLQHQAGNQAIQRHLCANGIQAKLAVGGPDDPAEREADDVAARVMRSPEPPCACGGTCDSCRNQPMTIRRRAEPGSPAHGNVPSSVARVLNSPGRPLDAAIRAFFEPRFGQSFDHVQVHTDPEAQQSARSIRAHAYASGQHLVFASGQYAPHTEAGKELLAHELTHVVQQAEGVRRNFFTFQPDPGDDPDPESLYGFYFVPWLDVDQASESMAKKLQSYVARHPNPYAFLRKVFDNIPSRHEDNVAAAFVALLDEAQLNVSAASSAGKELLDIFHEAMTTGSVSAFERAQAARIEQFGLARAKALQSGWSTYLAADTAPADSLVSWFEADIFHSDIDTASEHLARRLRVRLDTTAAPYDFIRQVFDALPSSWEDNVAAEFVALLDNSRLTQFAADAAGGALLNILYEALITGDVSAFERYEAERILQAKNAQTPITAYEAYQSHRRIFPVKNQKFFRDSYAPLRAELLPSGDVKVLYTTARIGNDEFKEDVATLGVSFRELMNGFVLKPNEIVSVRLYDGDDNRPRDIPALQLIQYSNEAERATLSLAAQAFVAGLTLPIGGLPEAGLARALAIADRVVWGISVVSSLVNNNREWIAKLPGGPTLLDALDTVDKFVAYYGYARLGGEGLKYAAGKLGPAWKAWHSAPKPNLAKEELEVLQQIDSQVEGILQNAEEEAQLAASAQAEKAGREAVDYVNQRHPPIEGAPGKRHVDVEGGHEIVEVADPSAPTGIGCEYHSPGGPNVPCPHGMGDEIDPSDPNSLNELTGPRRLTLSQEGSPSIELARRAGIPDEMYFDSTVMTRSDFLDVLPDRPVAIGRPAPPRLPPAGRTVSRSGAQNIEVELDRQLALAAGANPASIRVNQRQIIEDLQAGTNRPDLYFELSGYRIHIEYDRFPMTRAMEHARRILSNDPDAIVILKGIGYD